jgi:predicted transcriptional regulator
LANVLISIKPQFTRMIIAGDKTHELRRRFSLDLDEKSRILIYCSQPVSAIIAKAEITKVHYSSLDNLWRLYRNSVGLAKREFLEYFSDLKKGFAICLSNVHELELEVSNMALRDRFDICPPQSYRFISDDTYAELTNGTQASVAGYKYNCPTGGKS